MTQKEFQEGYETLRTQLLGLFNFTDEMSQAAKEFSYESAQEMIRGFKEGDIEIWKGYFEETAARRDNAKALRAIHGMLAQVYTILRDEVQPGA